MPVVKGTALGGICPGFAGGGSVADAVAAANDFAASTGAGGVCLPDEDKLQKRSSAIDLVGDCCFYVVAGTAGGFDGGMMGGGMDMGGGGGEGGGGNKKTSSQLCNSNDECDSGVCQTSKKTPAVPKYAAKCYAKNNDPRTKGKKGVCKIPGTADEIGQTFYKCLAREFAYQGSTKTIPELEKAPSLLSESLGLAWDASAKAVGDKLFSRVAYAICDGPSGYLFEPQNPDRSCTDMDDCQQKCIQEKSCNWLGEFAANVTTAECTGNVLGDSGTHFCATEESVGTKGSAGDVKLNPDIHSPMHEVSKHEHPRIPSYLAAHITHVS